VSGFRSSRAVNPALPGPVDVAIANFPFESERGGRGRRASDALGFVLVDKATETVDFAHGDLMMRLFCSRPAWPQLAAAATGDSI
jgi:hypothetical protein